ncbi:MAG: acyltransferase family protein [Alphaproteobacteria bacterium]
MNSSKLNYRAEIDGLRAIAIVSVILYHAQMVLFGRDWFEGGFIGVDIFFVISGYLITRIILSEIQSNSSFSFLGFYERRARRILPMLFVVIFGSIPFAWQRLLPSDFVDYAESILTSLFFGSNFFFYYSTTEYGADSALLKPFLHTWSLAVEEQFYLVFPIFVIVTFKYFRKHFLTFLVGLSLLSLQFSVLMEVHNSDLNFYLPFSRFWELAVGSRLAYRELHHRTPDKGVAAKFMPTLGLFLIAYSILFFDSKTPHPSFHTLIPIIGAALIIGFASKDELIGKALGSKPFVWVGLISYSAYLWHFPIFAFERVSLEKLSNLDKLLLILFTFAASAASYFFVERVFRNRSIVSGRLFALLLIVSTSVVVMVMSSIISKKGFDQRLERVFSSEARAFENSLEEVKAYVADGLPISDRPKVILLGDSYTKNWGVFGAHISSEYDVFNINYLGCPFVFSKGAVRLKKGAKKKYIKHCKSSLSFLSDKRAVGNIGAVILVSHRPFSYGANRFRFNAINHMKMASPSAEIFIMGNYFQLEPNEFNGCLNLMYQRGDSDAKVCRKLSAYFNPMVETKELKDKKIDTNAFSYEYVSLFEVLRHEDGRYPFEYKGVPFMSDWNHMNKAMIELFSLRLGEYDGVDPSALKLKMLLK